MRGYRHILGWLAVLIAAVTVFSPLRGTTVAAQAMPASVEAVTEPTLLLGDANGDAAVNTLDVVYLFRFVSGEHWMTVEAQRRCDVNADACVDSGDVLVLFYMVAGVAPLTSSAPTTATAIPTTVSTSTTTAPTRQTALRGIDVSYAQGTISWQEVKETDVSFAILRCGYGDDEPGQQDVRWEENVAACEKYGIPYGAYFFCYARNAEEAAREAKHALRLLEGKSPTYPVFLDMEYSTWQGDLTPAQCAEVATVFCETVSAAGYKVGVYANLDWWENRLTAPCFDRWYRWVAQYNEECDYEGTFHMWQYSERGLVDGIDGRVDMNYCYTDFTTA